MMEGEKNIVLSWNEKDLEVTGNKNYTYESWSSQSSYTTEETANGENMPKSKAVAPGKGSLSFDVRLSILNGVDVEAEYKWWRAECNKGTESILYLGNSLNATSLQFGEYKWRLVGVSQSDLIILPGGKWKSCTMSISFEESAYKVKQTKLEKKAAKLTKKAEKLMKKALNAKTEKARDKYAKKVAEAQYQAEQAQQAAMEEYVALVEKERENREAISRIITQYYDEQ